MIGAIALREIRDNLSRRAFRWMTAALLLLFAVSLALLAEDYRERRSGYDLRDRGGQTRAGKRPKLTAEPSPLSLLVRGLESQAGRMLLITWSQPRRQPGAIVLDQGDRNPLLDLYPAPDAQHLVKFVVSLLALFLAHDAFCGERVRGTLQLMFATPLSRGAFAAGKLLGAAASLLLALAPSALLIVGVLALTGSFEIGAEGWRRTAWLALLSGGYLLLFVSLGVWVSALARTPATSLLLLLGLWTVWMVGLPNLSTHVARWLRPVPSVTRIEAEKSELREGDFDSYFDYANACWAVDDRYVARVDDQIRFARDLSRLSPLASFTYASAALAATGLPDAARFRDQVIAWDRRQRRDGYGWEGDIPFAPAAASVEDSLSSATADIVLIALWNGLFFALALRACHRGDLV